jgi:outer membrane protein OmpA-like peptidoglycan-associated protein
MASRKSEHCKSPWPFLLPLLLLLPLLFGFLGAKNIENKLLSKSRKNLTASGIAGVKAKFSGQDGTFTGPAALEAQVRELNGVGKLDGVRNFTYVGTGGDAPVDSVPATEPAVVSEASPTEAPATEAVVTEPVATDAPTTVAAVVETTLAPATSPLNVTAAITGKTITLSGVITDETQRATLVDAAKKAYGDPNVTDSLTVEGTASATQAPRVQGLASLLELSSTTLSEGQGRVSDSVLEISGTAFTEEGKASLEAKASEVSATSTVTVAAAATSAAEVQTRLAELLGREGINFDTNSATITEPSKVILDQAVISIKDEFARFPNLAIEVGGHTDSRGSASANQRLSERRAASVLQYLTDNGVDGARITSKGFGASQPVADNATQEGQLANRRIEFKVTGS